jgi:putative ABC transport system permease protein
MFGVVIGVSSVLIAVSVGEGVRNQVVKQISQLGDDVVTIVPGRSFVTNEEGQVVGFNSTGFNGASSLTNKDIESIRKIEGVKAVSPNYLIAGLLSTVETQSYARASIIATTPEISEVLDKKLEFGQFFNNDDNDRKVVVIGSSIANDMFNQRDPIGRKITIRGEDFIVRGVLEPTAESPIDVGFNYNYSVYMPIGAGQALSEGSTQISQVNIKLAANTDANTVSNQIRQVLLQNHDNQEDFTVIQQEDFLRATDQIFSLLTGFVAAVAGISLFVGGVGIMNIMLVSVSERTREIGVRKAVGATNRQIVSQFLIEAMVLSVMGGIIGIMLSFVAAYFIKIYTNIIPSLSLPLIALAFGVSVAVGIILASPQP